MSMTQLKYTYKISITFLVKGKEVKIGSESIKMLLINYDYTKVNAPLAVLKLKLSSSNYNILQENQEKSKAILIVNKLDDQNKSPVKYIKKQFSYYFPNYNTSSDNDTDENLKEGSLESYIDCAIGLIDIKSLNNNKRLINGKFNNTNTISIIHQYTKDMKMIIEPFDYNDDMNTCYITPLEGISKLLEYLNDECTFYSSGYKFFMDYNYTYLLSNKGDPIDIKDQTYTTIQFEVTKQVKYDGMGIDKENKLYLVKVQENQIDIGADRITDKLYTQLVGIGSDGKVKKVDLNVHNEEESSKTKPKVIRISNNNFNLLEEMKKTTEATGDIIVINTINIDNSLIVPYKEYIINFNKERKHLSGKYVLYSKREVYTSEGEGEFKGSLNISLIKKS